MTDCPGLVGEGIITPYLCTSLAAGWWAERFRCAPRSRPNGPAVSPAPARVDLGSPPPPPGPTLHPAHVPTGERVPAWTPGISSIFLPRWMKPVPKPGPPLTVVNRLICPRPRSTVRRSSAGSICRTGSAPAGPGSQAWIWALPHAGAGLGLGDRPRFWGLVRAPYTSTCAPGGRPPRCRRKQLFLGGSLRPTVLRVRGRRGLALVPPGLRGPVVGLYRLGSCGRLRGASREIRPVRVQYLLEMEHFQ